MEGTLYGFSTVLSAYLLGLALGSWVAAIVHVVLLDLDVLERGPDDRVDDIVVAGVGEATASFGATP